MSIIEQLGEELTAIDRKRKSLHEKIAKLKEELVHIEGQAEAVKRIKESLGQAQEKAKPPSIQSEIPNRDGVWFSASHGNSDKKPFTEAAIEYVRKNPGATRNEVVDALHDEHANPKAKAPRRSLKSGLFNLIQKGDLFADKANRLWIPGQEQPSQKGNDMN